MIDPKNIQVIYSNAAQGYILPYSEFLNIEGSDYCLSANTDTLEELPALMLSAAYDLLVEANLDFQRTDFEKLSPLCSEILKVLKGTELITNEGDAVSVQQTISLIEI